MTYLLTVHHDDDPDTILRLVEVAAEDLNDALVEAGEMINLHAAGAFGDLYEADDLSGVQYAATVSAGQVV